MRKKVRHNEIFEFFFLAWTNNMFFFSENKIILTAFWPPNQLQFPMTEAINKAPAPELRDCKGSLLEIAMLL